MAKRRKLPKDIPVESLDVPDDDRIDEDDRIDLHENVLVPLTEREEPSVLYLTGDAKLAASAIITHVPPDMQQCQCEWVDTRANTLGPKPLVRCHEAPMVIAFQKRHHGEDEPTGSMSLCADHKVLIEHMYPDQCYFRRITSDDTIGDFA